MADNDSNRLMMRSYPIVVWLFGLGALGVAVWLVVSTFNSSNKGTMLVAIIPFIFAFVLLGFVATIDTIIADRTTGLFSVRRQSLLRNVYKEFPLSDISMANVDSQTSRDKNGRTSNTYQLQIILRSGEVVPLETGYSSGGSGRREKANKISQFVGVSSAHAQPANLFNSIGTVMKMAEASVQQRYPGQEGTTDGVSWRIESRAMGLYPATRWVSTDFTVSDGFLMLTQKMSGASLNLGGMLGGLGDMLQRQALKMYGFGVQDTPGIAQPVAQLDPRLAQFYDARTSNPMLVQQLLNPWVIQSLITWAQQNPVTSVQSNEKIGPLLVLFSPSGTYACHFNAPAPGHENDLTQLGVELVRAQGGAQRV